jgi:NAD(P)H-nitrite reductase large subunit
VAGRDPINFSASRRSRARCGELCDKIFVREKVLPPAPKRGTEGPSSVVIVGGGAAGLAAADMLRREGYDGPLTIVSADASPPVDRPNLSKDYLAGTAQEDWIPLRPSDYYRDRRIDLLPHSRVSSLDAKSRRIVLENGKALEFGSLLLAPGADPVHLPIEGATDSQLHYLRTFADSKGIIAKATSAKRVVVVGASFIGLEVAASLRARGILVDVVAPARQPLERVMGAEVGLFIRKLHEAHGVGFVGCCNADAGPAGEAVNNIKETRTHTGVLTKNRTRNLAFCFPPTLQQGLL